MLKTLLLSLPKVAEPKKHLGFRDKLKWTGIILLLYFILLNVQLWGISPMAVDYFASLRAILAGRFDSIITLGIGPIVMGSIVLQLLVGAGVLKFDQSTEEGRAIYQGAQKLMAIAFTIFEAAVMVLSGQIPADPSLGGIAVFALIIQIFIGGMLIIMMDEVINKWGFGSGVGLFIAAGVCQQIIVGTFNWMPATPGEPIPGAIPFAIESIREGRGFLEVFVRGGRYGDILAIISTIGVLLVSIYAQSMKVEIPLSYGGVRGMARRFPLPFVYASNMPVIFTAALVANFQIWVGLLNRAGAVSTASMQKFLFYMLPHSDFGDMFVRHLAVGGVIGPQDLFAAFSYLMVMIVGSVIFAFLWVEMSNMDAKSLAERLSSSGMQIPGFRSDRRITERILQRYIPYITILGGAFVGLLAGVATLTGGFGGGTGVLLTSGIIYKLYEEIASEQAMEMQPLLRKFVGDTKLAF